MSPVVQIGKLLRKLLLLARATENWYDFYLFAIGLKKKVRLELKNGFYVDFEERDRRDMMRSENFGLYKALASAYLLVRKGFAEFDGSELKIRSGDKRSIKISVNMNKLARYDLLLESILWILSEPSLKGRFRIEEISDRTILCRIDGNLLRVRADSTEIYGVFETFFEGHYSMLDVRNRTVIDIGSSVGDSPIYFLRSGAKKVIGFEPDRSAFELAEENLRLNGLSDRVVLHNTFATSDKVEAVLSEVDGDVVMKLDCEGCEFDVLLKLSRGSLQKLEQVVLEYHSFPLSIFMRMRRSGFDMRYFDLFLPWIGLMYFVRR